MVLNRERTRMPIDVREACFERCRISSFVLHFSTLCYILDRLLICQGSRWGHGTNQLAPRAVGTEKEYWKEKVPKKMMAFFLPHEGWTFDTFQFHW